MNRGLNLPQIQRIMQEFEKESATMDMKEEIMSEAVDDVMDEGLEDEEEEGDKILKQVLDEIGVDLSQQVRPNFLPYSPPSCYHSSGLLLHEINVCIGTDNIVQLTDAPTGLAINSPLTEARQPVAMGEGGLPHAGGSGDAGGGGMSQEDALQARLDALRRG